MSRTALELVVTNAARVYSECVTASPPHAHTLPPLPPFLTPRHPPRKRQRRVLPGRDRPPGAGGAGDGAAAGTAADRGTPGMYVKVVLCVPVCMEEEKVDHAIHA